MIEKKFQPGDRIYELNDYEDNSLYLIVEGSVNLLHV